MLPNTLFRLYVNRHKGMALIERVESSDLSAADRAHVSRILRTMLRLPDAPGPSLRLLDIQIHKLGIINRIHEGTWRHVSMAGWERVPHRTLLESSAAGACRDFAGVRPAV
jgi:hypothetical protein